MRVPARGRVETVLAGVAATLGLLTLVWRNWIEIVLRVDPDGGDGSAEWWVVCGLLILALLVLALSRWETKRAAASPTS